MDSSTDPDSTGPDSNGLDFEEREAEVRLRIAVVTLFPELFGEFVRTSFVGRGQRGGRVAFELVDLREFGLGRHRSVDDTPYGGGAGMVLRADCVVPAIEAAEERLGGRGRRVLMTPQGRRLDASVAREFAAFERWVLVCGRYEGFDERVRYFVDDEVSLGDFVLTGGEIPAMALVEAAIRFVPGVLGNEESTGEESFSPELEGLLEYPQYTRPAEFRGHGVPEVLTQGDHAKIRAFRRAESRKRTAERRPDLLARAPSDSGRGRS